MPIIISQTYEIVTEESAQDGEAEERGFDFEDVPYTFLELVNYIKREGFYIPSCSPGVPDSLTTDVIHDRAYWEKGENRSLTLHPGRDARSRRYWEKACRASGVLKDSLYWRGLIADAHYRGLRALVTYRAADGYVVKGLAIQDALKGLGPDGRWFVWVDNFANSVALENVINVEQVEK